jgi:glucose-1-phosphate thymidylyltransferase
MQNNQAQREVIGLVPMAGKASRIAPLPCSKELYPIGYRQIEGEGGMRPKVVSHYLLERMRHANIRKAFIILREGKWDIPAYFGDGAILNMHLAYLMMNLPYGVPYTLDQAFPFVQDANVALGFPDMIFQPHDAYTKLIARLEESGADIVLGLFPADKPHKTDMVEFDADGHIRAIHIKPPSSELIYSWEIAVWTPLFSRYSHDFVQAAMRKQSVADVGNELFVGDVLQAAIRDNLSVEPVIFQNGNFVDIGTPEDLMKAVLSADKAGVLLNK